MTVVATLVVGVPACLCQLLVLVWVGFVLLGSVSAGVVVEPAKCCAPWRLRRIACETAVVLHIQVRRFTFVMHLVCTRQGGAGPKWEPHNLVIDIPG